MELKHLVEAQFGLKTTEDKHIKKIMGKET